MRQALRGIANPRTRERTRRRGFRPSWEPGDADAPPTKARPRALFHVRVKDARLVDLLEFYSEDRRTLESLGFEVEVRTTLRSAVRGHYDLCYVWWWHRAVPIALAWRLRRVPVVITGATHFRDPSQGRVNRRARIALTAIAARIARGNIAISNSELADLEQIGIRRTRVIYPGVDTGFYRPGEKAPVPTAVLVAQLNPGSIARKGVESAVRSARLVRELHPDFELQVIGSLTQDGRRVLDDLTRDVGSGGIRFLGELSREEKRDAMARAWFYLQPSRFEGFGLAVAEAMACGAVPICSRAGSLPEVVAGAGVLCDGGERSLSDALARLIRQSGERERLSREARDRAQAFSTTQRVISLRAAFIEWAILQPGGA
jgi:glycosyltransferase involved in cell wall biosynthesis